MWIFLGAKTFFDQSEFIDDSFIGLIHAFRLLYYLLLIRMFLILSSKLTNILIVQFIDCDKSELKAMCKHQMLKSTCTPHWIFLLSDLALLIPNPADKLARLSTFQTGLFTSRATSDLWLTLALTVTFCSGILFSTTAATFLGLLSARLRTA